MLLWFGANITMLGSLALWVGIMGAKTVEEAQAQSVPMCLSYLITRVGEWTMVMLGETDLSLLGVPLKSNMMVYLMFTCTMLIAGNLQFQGYTIHPIHAEHHVLSGRQFNYKGYLYLIWATIWHATILVLVGTGAKVLSKKATYGLVFEGANWCLSGGLALAFISNMTFQSLHHRDQNKELGLLDCFMSNNVSANTKGASSTCSGTDKISPRSAVFDICKAGTVVLLFAIAFANQKPNYTVFGCFFVVFVQSMLVLYENSSGLDSHDENDDDHDELTFEKKQDDPEAIFSEVDEPISKRSGGEFKDAGTSLDGANYKSTRSSSGLEKDLASSSPTKRPPGLKKGVKPKAPSKNSEAEIEDV